MTNVLVFTGNRSRHLTLVDRIAKLAHLHGGDCSAVFECSRPRRPKTPALAAYWDRVTDAEEAMFGRRMPLPAKGLCDVLALGRGEASAEPACVDMVRRADHVVVFGASWLKGELCAELIEKRAINLHAGISPEYRGSGCNFWALYDNRPDLIGCTIHYLAEELDTGDVLGFSRPGRPAKIEDPWVYSMNALVDGIRTIASYVEHALLRGEWPGGSHPQDLEQLVRDCRARDFTEEIATEALRRWAE